MSQLATSTSPVATSQTNSGDSTTRERSVAALLTLVFAVLLLLTMLLTHLRYTPPTPEEMAKMDLLQDSIMWGGEYVELGDLPELPIDQALAANGSDNPQEANQDEKEQDNGQNDMRDNGVANEPPKPVVQQHKQESPMKVKPEERKQQPAQAKTQEPDKRQPKPEKTGENRPKTTTKPQENNQPAAPKSKFDDKMKNAFGNNSGTGTGKAGNPNGTAGGKLTAGAPSITSGLSGLTPEHWATAPAPGSGGGTVVLRVTVNPRGNIVSASVVGGTCKDPKNRALCQQLALKSRFRVPQNKTTNEIGNVTYTIR